MRQLNHAPLPCKTGIAAIALTSAAALLMLATLSLHAVQDAYNHATAALGAATALLALTGAILALYSVCASIRRTRANRRHPVPDDGS